MRVAITGTPGTGKTTVADRLDTDLTVIHLNDVIRTEDLVTGTDPDRDSLVADLDAVRAWFGDRDDVVVESHLAHYLDVDKVVVLRCAPTELESRLADRDVDHESIEENVESERLDLVLAEAVDRHGEDRIYEIDTTGRDPTRVADDVAAVIRGDRDPCVGIVSFLES
ncbi:MAG: adenylate kinase family protein [Halodesulfurarchaeum sp.]